MNINENRIIVENFSNQQKNQNQSDTIPSIPIEVTQFLVETIKNSESLISKNFELNKINSIENNSGFTKETGAIKSSNEHLESLNKINSIGMFPLHKAIINKDFNSLKLVIEHGANVNSVNHNGVPAIHQTVLSQNLDALKILIENGAHVDLTDRAKMSALHLAIIYKNLDALKLLIEAGANVNLIDRTGQSPLHMTLRGMGNKLEILKILIDNNANLNQPDSLGNTPLHLSVVNQNIEALKVLIEAGADVEATNDKGETYSLINKMKCLGLPIKSSDYDVEFELRFLLLSVWSIRKKIQSSINNKTLDFSSWGRTYFYFIFLKFLKEFQQKNIENLSEFNDIVKIFEETGIIVEKPDLLLKKFDSGETIFMKAGWKQHAISLIFHGNYMVICNKGEKKHPESTLQIYPLDRTAKEAHKYLSIIKTIYDDASADEGSDFFYNVLPQKLGFTQKDFISHVIENSCNQKKQKDGNCWLVSPKGGLLALLALREMEKPTKLINCTFSELFRLIPIKNVYKQFSEFTRLHTLKSYLERDPDAIPRDHTIVKTIEEKFRSKEWKTVNDDNDLVSSTNSSSIYSKKDVMRWFADYKRKFNLDENYEILL